MPNMVLDGVVLMVATGPRGSVGYTSMGPAPIPHPPVPKYSVLKPQKTLTQRILPKLADSKREAIIIAMS